MSDHLVIQRVPLAFGSSKLADCCLHRLCPHGVASLLPAEDVFRSLQSCLLRRRLHSAPCFLWSHLISCVPVPRTSFASSSSLCRPLSLRQGFGTMDALTPLPAGLPACRWPHRFGLRRSTPMLGLGPVLAHWSPVRHLRYLLAIHSVEVSWVLPALLPNRAARHNLGCVRCGAVPSIRTGWGLRLAMQFDHALPRPYLPVQPFGLQLGSLLRGPPHLLLRERTAHSATSPVGFRRGLDFNQLEAGVTPRHIARHLSAGNAGHPRRKSRRS